MIKKKSVKKPDDHDFTALDAAVSELSKQTAALLGSAEKTKKVQKPTLPKKTAKPVRRGHSFDIISPKSVPKHATLKTAVSAKALESSEEHPLLADHAGYSFNERNPTPKDRPESIVEIHKPSISITHHAGSIIQPIGSEEESPASVLEVKTAVPAKSAEQSTRNEVKPVDSEDAEIEPKKKTPLKKAESQKPVTPEEVPAENEEKETQSSATAVGFESSGLYANNLANSKEPLRYEPHENQQKPTVFDTNEYHEPLHDWSKLERRRTPKIILLLVLLIAAGGIAYAVIAGIIPL